MTEISVVLPIYDEVEHLMALYQELNEAMIQLGLSYELIFVSDGSTDGSSELIEQITLQNTGVIGIILSRNFGHQAALMAGIERATGQLTITMDADFQHPISELPKMIEASKNGADIVNMIRTGKEQGGRAKRLTSRWFYRIVNRFGEVKIESNAADFRLMNGRAKEAFLRLKEKERFTRGLIAWIGFNQISLEYTVAPRRSGKSKYTTRKMIAFAGVGFFSFSSRPLRFAFYIGLLIFALGLVYASYSIIQNYLGNTIPGWTSLMVVILLLGGVQLLCLGIIGEYLARVFNEVKNRPIYQVKDEYHRKD